VEVKRQLNGQYVLMDVWEGRILSLSSGSMSQADNTRAHKKTQTRVHIRRIAQQLFADRGFDSVTIADVAAAADVSSQTVFNHFDTKEELFFDGRTAWVDGPAEAVRFRGPRTPPLTALREYLVDAARNTMRFEATAAGRTYTASIEASAALSAHERELVYQAERRLRDALSEAWAKGVPTLDAVSAGDSATLASLTSATWLAAIRALVVEHRQLHHEGEDQASLVASVAEQILLDFTSLCSPFTPAHRRTDVRGPAGRLHRWAPTSS
jgi:AcrR family transcriptional regulator